MQKCPHLSSVNPPRLFTSTVKKLICSLNTSFRLHVQSSYCFSEHTSFHFDVKAPTDPLNTSEHTKDKTRDRYGGVRLIDSITDSDQNLVQKWRKTSNKNELKWECKTTNKTTAIRVISLLEVNS